MTEYLVMAKKPGQPTKFDEMYCDQLIKHMSNGFSYESFAGKIQVCRDSLYAWEKANPTWKAAKEIAVEACLFFWEKQGIDGLFSETEYDEESGKPISSKSINATVWIFNMKNRHKWRDKQQDESEVVINNVSNLSDDELDRKIAEKMKKLGKKT